MGKMQAIKHRLEKAKNTWGATRKRFQNQNIHGNLRIQLRNALIRPTLTYAIYTQELTISQERKINGFAQGCMREITEKPGIQTQKKPQDTKKRQ